MQYGPKQSPSKTSWRLLLLGFLVHLPGRSPSSAASGPSIRKSVDEEKQSANQEFNSLACPKQCHLWSHSLGPSAAFLHLEIHEAVRLHGIMVKQG